LDGYGKLLARPQLVEKSAFNYHVGLKEIHMVKLTHNLEVHEILLWDQPSTGGNPHILTMMESLDNDATM
jgi:hypothetical protein